MTVADAVLLFRAMAGDASARTIGSLQGLRIGIPRRLIADNVLTDARKPAYEQALQALAQAGATIVDPCDLPSAVALHEVRSSVFRTEFKASLNALLAQWRPCGMRSMQDIIDWNRQHPEAIPYVFHARRGRAGAAGGAVDRKPDRRADGTIAGQAGLAWRLGRRFTMWQAQHMVNLQFHHTLAITAINSK